MNHENWRSSILILISRTEVMSSISWTDITVDDDLI